MTRPALALLLALSTFTARAEPPPEPQVEKTVAEDDQVRIEELKVRGAAQKVTVRHKNSKAPDYEIVVLDAGRESAGGSGKSGSGQRVWRVLNF